MSPPSPIPHETALTPDTCLGCTFVKSSGALFRRRRGEVAFHSGYVT